MVKLTFNPKKDQNDLLVSKITKKIEKVKITEIPFNLNPFQDNENCEKFETNPESFLPVKDIIGLENTSYILKNWYTQSLNDISKPLLLIIGPTGCGKTTLVDSFCKEEDIILYNVKFKDCSKKDLLREIILFSEYSSTSFFNVEQTGLKKLILIDEYQNGQNDLLSITDINRLLSIRSGKEKIEKKIINLPPILIISSDSKGSKLSDIKKTNEVCYINEIPQNLLKTWIMRYQPNQTLVNLIITKCRSDKRLILNVLNFIKTDKDIKRITTFIESFYKDFDVNIFEFVTKLFDRDEQKDTNELFKVYDTDGFLISGLVQENYIDYNENIDNIAKSADSISFAETVFSDTYESGKNFLPDLHCVTGICIPGYYSKTGFKKQTPRTSCINNRFNIYLNNKELINKINLSVFEIFQIKKFLNQELVKKKELSPNQEDFLKKLLNKITIEKLELIYKHFSEFKENVKEPKTKNFTLKFKEKLKKLKESK